MDWGSVPEWVAAIGSMATAAGALYLLKREGEDRRVMQLSERRREQTDRRRQASLVHVDEVRSEASGGDGGERWATYSVHVHNASSGVINHVFLDLLRNPKVFDPDDLSDVRYLGRLLPSSGRTIEIEARRPNENWDRRASAFVGTQLWFNDAAGVPFKIGRDHDLTEIDKNPHRV